MGACLTTMKCMGDNLEGTYVGDRVITGVSSTASLPQIQDFLRQVKPLDLLVFRGADGVSSLIRGLSAFTNGSSEASHVEVAISREWCPRINPIMGTFDGKQNTDQTLYSWGSTASGPLNDGTYNAETGKAKFGVQVRNLEDLVMHYLTKPNANVGLCRLKDNPINKRSTETEDQYKTRSAQLVQNLSNAYDRYNGVMYDINPFSLLGSMFPKLRPLRKLTTDELSKVMDADKWLFCSEFVATLYIAVGVINDETDGVKDGKTLNPSDVIPVDFLGRDMDKDGIVIAICDYPPLWIKDSNSVQL